MSDALPVAQAASEMSAEFFVGTSGWHYEHWRDRFYPKGLPKSRWLGYYAQHFRAVEINNSFYRLPSERAFANWHAQSPEGFVFAVKASRIITHYRKLRNVEDSLGRLLGRAAILKEKLGPILYQLPPTLARDDSLLERFLSSLPASFHHVVEFRHPSWFEEGVFDKLRRQGVAYCIISMPRFESPFAITSNFGYIRFHGSAALYAGRYTAEELERWAKMIHASASGVQKVYAFFNNDAEANAVYNALELTLKLSRPSD